MRGRTTRTDVLPEALQHLREELISVTVVERDLGRSADDCEHAVRSRPRASTTDSTRLEAVQVVLLLQARVPAHFRGPRAKAVEAILRDRVGDDHAPRGTRANTVLGERELVVEGIRRRNAERTGDERELVRRVGQGEVECAGLRIPAQSADAACHRAPFPDPARASVARPDDVVGDVVQLEQLQRLRVVAGRDVDRVAALQQQRDQRPEERDLRRVRDVDPDAHSATLPSHG